MKKLSLLFTLLCLVFVGYSQKAKTAVKSNKQIMQDGIYAQFNTSKGEVLIKLEHEKTPMTVANFVALAEGKMENDKKALGTPFYDGLKFHRVITKANGDAQDFMIQGGCPLGTGTGDPGYKFPDEFDKTLRHDAPGILSMANSGPNTNGSQFFITVVPTPWLDDRHSVFGKVVSGMEIANQIKTNDEIKSVKIIRQGAAAQAFKADKSVIDNAVKEMQRKAEEGIKADKEQFAAFVAKNYPNATTLPSGLAYIIEKKGTGENAKAGQKVSVHYNGVLENGNKFDNSYERGQPIEFPLGQGMVIPGWEEGIALLNKGAKGKLIIPYWLAYGEQGRSPVIPPKAILIFDTELMDVK